jgi:hypothetical protein
LLIGSKQKNKNKNNNTNKVAEKRKRYHPGLQDNEKKVIGGNKTGKLAHCL